MRWNLRSLLVIAAAVFAGCQAHQPPPYSDEYVGVPGGASVEYEYVPPPHPDYHFYHDHYGHRYEMEGLNATHGGYGSYGILYEE